MAFRRRRIARCRRTTTPSASERAFRDSSNLAGRADDRSGRIHRRGKPATMRPKSSRLRQPSRSNLKSTSIAAWSVGPSGVTAVCPIGPCGAAGSRRRSGRSLSPPFLAPTGGVTPRGSRSEKRAHHRGHGRDRSRSGRDGPEAGAKGPTPRTHTTPQENGTTGETGRGGRRPGNTRQDPLTHCEGKGRRPSYTRAGTRRSPPSAHRSTGHSSLELSLTEAPRNSNRRTWALGEGPTVLRAPHGDGRVPVA